MAMGNTSDWRSPPQSKRWSFRNSLGSVDCSVWSKNIIKGHYYAGKQKGYKYLNDTYILNVNTNRWSVFY